MSQLREPLPEDEVESDESRLTEGMVISRFLQSEIDWFTPERIAIPDSTDGNQVKETLDRAGIDCPVGGFNGPDLIGECPEGKIHLLEAKGGRKVVNNGKHDLSDVILRNFHKDQPCESASLIPRDKAYQFWRRLTNNYEGYKDKVAEQGIKTAIEGIKHTHPYEVDFSVYIVGGDEVEKMDFITFLETGDDFAEASL